MSAPGEYTVSMARREKGRLTDLDMEETFSVVALRERGLKGASPEAVVAFEMELDNLRRQTSGAEAAITELLVEADAIKSALQRSTASVELRDRAEAIRQRLLDLQLRLSGDNSRALFNEGGPVSISRRVSVAYLGTAFSTYGPTPTHQQSLEIASEEFVSLRDDLAEINSTELPALRTALDAAGVPWTPGR
jgi:hypothetical protein